MNLLILRGHLGQDPKSQTTESGRRITKFSVADNRRWTDDDGEVQEQVHWLPIVTFGRLAEQCHEYLQQGSQVLVRARVDDSRWTNDDGEKRRKLELVAKHVDFLDRASDPFDTPTEDIASPF